jgi:hypothetical protein
MITARGPSSRLLVKYSLNRMVKLPIPKKVHTQRPQDDELQEHWPLSVPVLKYFSGGKLPSPPPPPNISNTPMTIFFRC